jgi:UDP-N-acetylmuramate dehydrogenase
MTAVPAASRLIDRLPPVRGRYKENAPLAPVTWFRVGGPAEVLFRPADVDDLARFLAERPADVPITILGVASNVLIRDGGVPGVVIRLGREFAGLAVDGTDVRAGAAAMDVNLARLACTAGIAGLEFLSGVPGTIGGALRMNAGAFGGEMKDVVVAAEALDSGGRRHCLSACDLGFGYRSTAVPADWIFVSAHLRGHSGDPAAIARRMDEIRAQREQTQPIRVRTGGSTFTNPPGGKAWELIAAAGCRGLTRGGAMVAEKHCNFLINTGSATAADLEALGEEVRRRVFQTSGVALHWEIRRIGVAAPGRGPEPKIVELAP